LEGFTLNAKQTILITGATGSIGGGAAVELVKRGAQVVLLGRNQEKLNARVKLICNALSKSRIKIQDTDIATLEIDFSDMKSVRNAAAEALRRFPEIHGLILSSVTLIQKGPNILSSGHEVMFATNVMGPFLFSNLLIERMQKSDGMILHVIAPFTKKIDWDDLESIKKHKTNTAYERTKTCHRAIAGELARRYDGKISSVAFNPTFIIDKSDPELKKRWPSGLVGFFWSMMTLLFAKAPKVSGEPIANLMLNYGDRSEINGAMFKLRKRSAKLDKAMNDRIFGKRLWDELVQLTGLTPE